MQLTLSAKKKDKTRYTDEIFYSSRSTGSFQSADAYEYEYGVHFSI